MTLGLFSAIRRNFPAHRGNVIGSYLGIAIAFGFAVGIPGRSIPQLLASDPWSAVFVAVLVVLSVAAVYLSLLRGGRGRVAAVRTKGKSDGGTRRGADLVDRT